MRSTTTSPTRLLALSAVLAVTAFTIAQPATGGASTTDPPRIVVQHTNERLLDTRSGPKPSDGWTTNIQLPENTHDALDWELNVQIVQAVGDGWVEVSGQSAVVHNGGRDNTSISTFPLEAGGFVPVTVHGASTHVIVDLVAYTHYENTGTVGTVPTCDAGQECP